MAARFWMPWESVQTSCAAIQSSSSKVSDVYGLLIERENFEKLEENKHGWYHHGYREKLCQCSAIWFLTDKEDDQPRDSPT